MKNTGETWYTMCVVNYISNLVNSSLINVSNQLPFIILDAF